ncbi:chemotaxis protein CheD [Leptospira semungkisensis]|uniref:Probable chemoreceptor glutamine deamidase CheD n=1 Tax=Leptospira semungkisensis TaxID=2484985 RepID=A0A4R9FLT2_9LEPT|nr:chemotaxis protein CheD [Leptospira semungkisensis]TGJ99154.1 chemotaxis protein CheD [Leptospira semungkisensis]
MEPDIVKDIFLQPGGLYWGENGTRIRTLLGSCVAVCLWHPYYRVGGMAHIMLPKRPASIPDAHNKYADDAIETFLHKFLQLGERPGRFVCKIFGGASMFSPDEEKLEEVKKIVEIGDKNVEAVQTLIKKANITLAASHTGGTSHRKIYFSLWDGEVYMENPKN